MEIPAIGTAAAASSVTNQSEQSLADSFDTFLTLLTTQLRYQDPLEPMESAEFTNQLVQFTQVEQSISTNKQLEQLIGMQGANQAVAAKRLGREAVHVKFIGVFGNDGNATMLNKTLEDEGIDLSQSQSADVPNGQAIIFIDEHGENSIIIIAGSNGAWPKTLSKEIIEAVQNSDVLLLQREIPDFVNIAVAKAASQAGCTVVCDVGGADTVCIGLTKFCSLVVLGRSLPH